MKQRIEFSRHDGKTLNMYWASERYCFLGCIDFEKALSMLSKSQQQKLKQLYAIDEIVDGDIIYYKKYEVVLTVDKGKFREGVV